MQARHFCCLRRQLRLTATKSQAESVQARPGTAERALGKSPVVCRQEEEEGSALSGTAATTFQQQLLIELPARGKFSAGAYSYQPHNTAGLFKTSSRGTLPKEQHTRGQVQLGGWEDSRNLEPKSRSRVLQWEALSLQTAPCLPQPDPLCRQVYHYTLTPTSTY